MRRIMIVGGPGSGKSTLARTLGARLGLPVHHMDHIHWQGVWDERPKEEKIRLAHAVEAQDAWVFEGGNSATYDNRMARADTVIWLDLPVGLRLWRVTKRTLRYVGRTRPDLPEGCRERLNRETVVFYRFIWRMRHVQRAKIAERFNAARPDLTRVHLRSPAEVRAWLAQI
ncbi:AAA family ATPase [Sulfitobacter albidus]|uniref:AAA family ATPase n=1 Tax=Sulfitobacter albidus TaxID=2829501 RepID=A0A975PN30_9RHOB|nr:AAA family ATPase [Sulfitobacter albidus]QUJ77031.1 AAA family ATPase [Sulfitobacter albidus]